MIRVRAAVCVRSAPSRPQAEKLPAYGGTTISSMSSSRASSVPKSGPAPPNGISRASRGSCPRSIVISRIASAMFAAAIVMIPAAASLDREAELLPRAARALRAPARGRARSRSRAVPSPSMPSKNAASVTVGARRRARSRPGRGRRRAAGPDPQQAADVDVGDRAAAGADRAHVDPRRLHGQADDLALVHQLRPAVGDQARVEARAADVGGDHVAEAELRYMPGDRRPSAAHVPGRGRGPAGSNPVGRRSLDRCRRRLDRTRRRRRPPQGRSCERRRSCRVRRVTGVAASCQP